MTPPPDKAGAKTEPVAIKRVAVEDFDFASVDKDLPPNFIKMRAEGIAIGTKPIEGVDLAQLAGLDKITADFQLDYRLDPERKTLTLNRLELDLAGLARMELSLVLDGVSADQIGKPDAAMNDATLRTATLAFEDRSLLSKVLPAAAKLQSTDADALVKMGTGLLNGLRAGQGPQALAVIDAIVSYMDDYKQPKGPLRVTLNPPGKTSAATLTGMASADEAIKALGTVVSYAGTKPGRPPRRLPPRPPRQTPAARPERASSSCTTRAGQRSRCARRASPATNAWPGSMAAAPTTMSPLRSTRRLPWSIDGPGQPVAKCNGGAKVLVENDGAWYPAKSPTSRLPTAKCPIKYQTSDGDEETVEMKRWCGSLIEGRLVIAREWWRPWEDPANKFRF